MRTFFERKKQRFRRLAAAVLCIAMAVSLAGCGSAMKAAVALAEPAKGDESSVEKRNVDDTITEAYRNFSMEMFRREHAKAGSSMTVSPFSLIFALGMAANGASGTALAEMESVFGMPRDTLNGYLATLVGLWTKDQGLQIADSVWLNNKVADKTKKAFLDICSKTYRASVFRAPFDETTITDVNRWVSDNTGGMIPEMLRELKGDTDLLLINAVLFDRDWSDEFRPEETEKNAPFYDGNGNKIREVDLMHEVQENSWYYQDDLCTVAGKLYKGGDFRFVAFQPREGVSLADMVAAMNADYLKTALDYGNRRNAEVTLELPKFTTDYRCDLNEVLQDMGIREAFYGGLTEITEKTELRIDDVMQQVRVEMDEKGTRAAATTVVAVTEAALPMETEKITVRLDRPFVYMIVAGANDIPIFIGTYE
ncbi:MAG: serpin family protein [Lachnospiraceae bacterium]|nr:serpin family protein [Lachnospiraceae bacterium]